jgi:endonuclease IV
MLVGPHVNRYHAPGARPSIVEHIEAAAAEALAEAGLAVTAAAIFVGGPKNREITLRGEERAQLREYVKRTGLRVIAHSSYSAQPWRGDPDAARYIREELGVCQEAGIAGLVVHLPKLPVEHVMRYIARLCEPGAPDVRLYFETPAVRPAESYYETPEKLAALFAAIRAEIDPRLEHFGLCVDTAHLWTCGVDLRSYEAADEWLRGLEAAADVIPPAAVMIHLNDSARARGVGPDTHAGLAHGKIWEGYLDRPEAGGLAAFTDYAQRHETPVILERKPKEALKHDYLVLRKLTPRPPPPPSPPNTARRAT